MTNNTVLYIEDNPQNINLMQRLLGRRLPETRLVTAATGREGVSAAGSERPDLILLDNRLPDASGGDVLRQLAAGPATAGIPVIIISGDSGAQTASELRALGAVGFITKPFDIHELIATIGNHLH